RLLTSQRQDGTWGEDYGQSDTSFALLFLARSNLVRDLTDAIKGTVSLKSSKGDKDKGGATSRDNPADLPKTERKPLEGKPVPPPEEVEQPANKGPEKGREPPAKATVKRESEAAKLGKELVSASPARQDQLLDQFREAKGGEYTDSLAKAIHRLEGDAK